MGKIWLKLMGYRCQRCGHQWIPRDKSEDKKDEEPRVCPKCKSPYWNKPRRTDRAATDVTAMKSGGVSE